MKMNTIRTMMVSTEVQYNITINIEESMSYSENLYTYISTVTVLYYSVQQIYLRGCKVSFNSYKYRFFLLATNQK